MTFKQHFEQNKDFKIKINNILWNVKFKDENWFEKHNNDPKSYGRLDYKYESVYINSGYSMQHKILTFFHEITHDFINLVSSKYRTKSEIILEEIFTEMTAKGLYDLYINGYLDFKIK